VPNPGRAAGRLILTAVGETLKSRNAKNVEMTVGRRESFDGRWMAFIGSVPG